MVRTIALCSYAMISNYWVLAWQALSVARVTKPSVLYPRIGLSGSFPPTEGRGNGALCYMSEIFRIVLAACLDWSTMALRRVDNYRVLAAKLGAVAPFPQLSSKVFSLDLPVCLMKRDQVRQTLFDYEIRASIHWQEQGIVPGRFWHSHELVAGVPTIQCDQRYGIDKMQRVAQTFRREAR